MKRIIIIASGTRGDVQPAIALGKALQTADYTVALLASPNFRQWIEAHGLEASVSSVDVQAIMESEGGKEWVERGHNPLVQARVMRKLLKKFGWALVQDGWEACQGADAVISSFTSDAFAATIAEKMEIPHFSMPLQPTMIATKDGRSLPNAPLPNRISRINAWFGRFLIEPFPWQLYGEHINRLRRQIGLSPQNNRQNVAARRRMTILHAYSRHVAPPPADWPPNFHVTGYWFLDEEPNWQPPPALTAFLEAGEPPVYIGFGSMTNRDPQATTRLIVEALERCGKRAVLLSGWAGMGQTNLPSMIFRLTRAPHSWLFPRMTAVVHHGGAGTFAAGLRAGVPTVVVPHMVDQPYWAQRAVALGVAPKPTPRHKLTAVKLANAIEEAATSGAMRQKAMELSQKIKNEDGLGRALEIVRHVLKT